MFRSLGRPKRAGEDYARTHHNDEDVDSPSSPKRPRFDLRNPSALAPDVLEDDAVLDADEIGRRGQQVRRNAVNIDGYDSDSETEAFNARAEAKAVSNKVIRQGGTEDGDDMFAELEEEFRDADPNTTGTKRKRVRFLQDAEIEGQVADSWGGHALSVDLQSHSNGKGKQMDTEDAESESDVDEEERAALAEGVDEELGAGAKKTHAPLLDAFNMRSEQQEGRFDDQGNYIRKAADPDAIHDTWLEGVSKKDIRMAKEAAERRDEERRQRAIDDDSVLTKDILKILISHLERGETILECLARLGKGHERKPKWQNKNKNKSKPGARNTTGEDVEMGQEDPAVKSRKQTIEDITGAADILLTRGQTEIYDAQRELLIRQYWRETGEEWVDPPHSNPDSSDASGENTMWEYRWSDARDGGEKHGPYEGAMMESWSIAGYFGEGVEFRRAGDTGAWNREVDFLH